jgi:hypothetical protein
VELAARRLLRARVEQAVSLTGGAVRVRHALRHGPVVRNLL